MSQHDSDRKCPFCVSCFDLFYLVFADLFVVRETNNIIKLVCLFPTTALSQKQILKNSENNSTDTDFVSIAEAIQQQAALARQAFESGTVAVPVMISAAGGCGVGVGGYE